VASDDRESLNGDALGFVETFGLIAAVEAADAMGKAARVRVKSVCNADAGLLCVVCEGDLAACRAAVDAGRASAERLGGYVSSNLIARPWDDTGELITRHVGSMFRQAAKQAPSGTTAKQPPAGKGKAKGKAR